MSSSAPCIFITNAVCFYTPSPISASSGNWVSGGMCTPCIAGEMTFGNVVNRGTRSIHNTSTTLGTIEHILSSGAQPQFVGMRT